MIKISKRNSQPKQRGFTLVEIMVGMAIGMLVTLVIVQVMSVFEGQKRATSGTADSQTNGAIAMHNISRELQLAGYGLIPTGKDQPHSALKCDTVLARPAGTAGAGLNVNPLSITNGVSDSITVRYGNSLLGGMPSLIRTVSGLAITVDNNLGCSSGDFVLITKNNQCALSKLAKASDAPPGVAGNLTLNLKGDDPTDPDDQAETMPATATPEDSSIICLGDSWSQVNFAVSNGNLQKGGIDSVAGIVNIQAQYGISASATSNVITSWVNPTGGTWGAPNLANRNRIKALRIAVVARNPKREQAEVTQGCSAAAPNGPCAWEGSTAPAIDLSADADWKHYRYRVFETIVPLRNMIWNAGTLN